MKKILFTVLALSLLFTFTYNNATAATIGLKGGYTMPKDDYKDYDNTPNFGIYFDMGKFIFNNLNFRPGLDYFTLDGDKGKFGDVWGIHLDWYWFFMGKKPIAPFLGFGPSLNYYDFDEGSTNEDSDAGVDLFLGADFKLTGPLTLMVEGRFKFLDIANRNETAMQLNLGIAYSF